MESIFAAPWEELELSDVVAFLRAAGDEGITWEAKGADPRRREESRIEASTVRAAICGLANAVGGYVLVGAERDPGTREWSFPGVAVPHDEPATWLDDVAESLRPRPRTDAHIWPLEDGRTRAVLEVEPVAVPPCMTAGGEIFERTSGKTVRVTDPLVLARLSERGERARKAAEDDSRSMVVGGHLAAALRDQHRSVIVKLGLRAIGYDADIAARLFRESTAKELKRIVVEHLRRDRYTANNTASTTVQVRQSAVDLLTVSGPHVTDSHGGDRVWRVVATWGGAVGIHCEGNDPEIGIEILFDEIIVPAWRAAAQVVPLLGGYGGAHFVLDARAMINAGREEWPTGNVLGDLIERDLDVIAPTAPMVESLKRELLRSMQHPAWEPEPGSD